MSYKAKTYKLAEEHGCEIEVYDTTASIYLHAPEGKLFRSVQSGALNAATGGWFKGSPKEKEWKQAYDYFKAEIAEGFENG